MKKINSKGGFTLIELLVVVAIIGILASITMGYLGSARKKGNDTSVKSNLTTVRALSEIFYLDNDNSYLPPSGVNFGVASCPLYDVNGTNMFSQNESIAEAIAKAVFRGNGGSSCANSVNSWAIAVDLNLDTSTSWCTDNSGMAKISPFNSSNAINPVTFLCNL